MNGMKKVQSSNVGGGDQLNGALIITELAVETAKNAIY